MGQVDFTAMRAAMVASQLRTSDVNAAAVVAAMSSVAREDFMPAARRDTAYVDRPIPLGNGRAVNPPLATGRILTIADIAPGDRVLLLGDATGYAAALLAHMGASVTAVDENAPAAPLPASVSWVKGKGRDGHAAGAPYDVILIDGAAGEFPAALSAQLADGGRMAMGRIERGVARLVSGRKAGGTVGFVSHADMEMATVPGFEAKHPDFIF